SLEHIWGVFNFIFPPGSSKPGVPALERRANVDLQSPYAKELIEAIRARQVFVSPTLTVFRNMQLLADLPEVYQHPDNARMPEQLKEYWLKDQAVRMKKTLTPETLDLRRREFQKYKDLTGILYRAGVPLLAGTDAPEPFCPPGFSLHQELELLVESGLTPAAALQAATLNNARILRADKELGSIQPGKLADIVILNADPLASIQNSRKIFRVIKAGKVYDPNRLLRVPRPDPKTV
ncbi:MAG TPA: amidohydrolase family protein, partial [Bryobacteraceae bacterium]|nr:amidohydrolase family protein [Bryobacteraceae bacterium]